MKTTNLIWTSIFAIIPVLLFGTSWLFTYLDADKTIQFALFISSIASVFILFGIGWVKDFPKWTIHSIGFCLFISLMLMNISSPYLNRTDTWGLIGLLPFSLTLIISLSIHFSLQPLRQLFKQIKEEKNIIIFIFYSILPLILWFEFDEISNVSVIPYIIILTILTALSVTIYLISSKKVIRTLTLILGIFITNAIAITATTLLFD
ncbi:MAG: hypothetical protein CVU12_09695 [Bacteroidetes bacterium HGW-Bacteroidetes-7]|jgi:hypothetical protein|nr:MAG: hypothetical protein CVU12_09695 [Bacteroidetes bacterium HGW-Bacteroidetes-7]